jgi:hypothetical protein
MTDLSSADAHQLFIISSTIVHQSFINCSSIVHQLFIIHTTRGLGSWWRWRAPDRRMTLHEPSARLWRFVYSTSVESLFSIGLLPSLTFISGWQRVYGAGLGGTSGRGLHSSTFQLNLSAAYGIGGGRKGCVARVKGVSGGV